MVHEDMKIFAAVVEAGSFTTAARRLRMAKSTVSHRLAELERRLGARLLQRTTRAVRPTEIGLTYHERCVRILADIEEAEGAVQRQQSLATGTLRLCVPIEFGMHIMGPVIAEFCRQHGQVKFDVELTSRHIDLVEERFDLALRIGELPDSRLISRKLLSVPRGVYASAEYLEHHGSPKQPIDLEEHHCLHFFSPYVPQTWTLRRGKDQVVVTPNVVVRMNNLTMLRTMALAGSGIVTLPRYMCDDSVRRGALVPVLTDWEPSGADVFVLYPSGQHLPLRVRAFIKHLDGEMRAIAKQLSASSRTSSAHKRVIDRGAELQRWGAVERK